MPGREPQWLDSVFDFDSPVKPRTQVSLLRFLEARARVVRADDPFVLVEAPLEQLAGMHPNEHLRIRFGIRDEAGYLAEGVVDRVVPSTDGTATVSIRVTSGAARRQQRRHVRTPAFDVQLIVRDARDADADADAAIAIDGDATWVQAYGHDISAGGVRFTATQPLPVGVPVELRVQLPHDQRPLELSTAGRIVWGIDVPDASSPEHRHQFAATFTNLARQLEDEIVAWVFDRERSHLA